MLSTRSKNVGNPAIESPSQQDIHRSRTDQWHGTTGDSAITDNVNDAIVRAERPCRCCPSSGCSSRSRSLLGPHPASQTPTRFHLGTLESSPPRDWAATVRFIRASIRSPCFQLPFQHRHQSRPSRIAGRRHNFGQVSLPKNRFSLSQLNWNNGSYSLRMPCSRSSFRCSIRFGKVSGAEPYFRQRSWLSGISSSYCSDRTAATDRA
jgi:hypothetical protein